MQVGWYVGSAGGMPYTSAPRVFWGEYSAGAPNGEVLHAGAVLSLGTWHKFQLSRTGSTLRAYNVFVDGQLIATSTANHFQGGTAAFTGETNSTCDRVSALASQAAAPYPSLYYQSNSTWYQFYDSYYADAGHCSAADHGRATDFAS